MAAKVRDSPDAASSTPAEVSKRKRRAVARRREAGLRVLAHLGAAANATPAQLAAIEREWRQR